MSFWQSVKNFFNRDFSTGGVPPIAVPEPLPQPVAADMERVTSEFIAQMETDFTLVRVCENENGTFGVLLKGDVPICVTVEDRWRDNKRRVSCIPEDVYFCVPHSGPRFKNVWLLEDVPDRSAILIHAGNTEDSTEGCIIVGSSFGKLGSKWAILDSRKALNRLRSVAPPEFTIRIRSL